MFLLFEGFVRAWLGTNHDQIDFLFISENLVSCSGPYIVHRKRECPTCGLICIFEFRILLKIGAFTVSKKNPT